MNPNLSNIPTESLVKHLFQTDNPQQLFAEVYNKSVGIDNNQKNVKNRNNNELLEEKEDFTFLPPVQVSKTNTANKIPKNFVQEERQNNKNGDVLKNLLGETYYNNLLSKPVDGGGSILESFANISSPNFENYEVVTEQPPPKKSNDQISLIIEGKSYSGKIIQNKKGQILFLINSNQAFVLTPSSLKTVTKK